MDQTVHEHHARPATRKPVLGESASEVRQLTRKPSVGHHAASCRT